MKKIIYFLPLLLLSMFAQAQFAFELKIDFSTRIQNSDMFSVSGVIKSGRIENGKDYFLEDGTKIHIDNVISSKSATSVPVATAPEGVSLGISCKDFRPERGDLLKAISTKPLYGSSNVRHNPNKTAEGILVCKINGRMYQAKSISKPVFVKTSNMLDLFFMAEDKSVVWLQLNQMSEITEIPHVAKSDTSIKDISFVCKVVYMPDGYRPTDMPNNYRAFEDVKGNAGITVTFLDKYQKKLSLEFSGIIRANDKMREEKPNVGLFYITEGRVDNIGWDTF